MMGGCKVSESTAGAVSGTVVSGMAAVVTGTGADVAAVEEMLLAVDTLGSAEHPLKPMQVNNIAESTVTIRFFKTDSPL